MSEKMLSHFCEEMSKKMLPCICEKMSEQMLPRFCEEMSEKMLPRICEEMSEQVYLKKWKSVFWKGGGSQLALTHPERQGEDGGIRRGDHQETQQQVCTIAVIWQHLATFGQIWQDLAIVAIANTWQHQATVSYIYISWQYICQYFAAFDNI